jgi:hypothetical protein
MKPLQFPFTVNNHPIIAQIEIKKHIVRVKAVILNKIERFWHPCRFISLDSKENNMIDIIGSIISSRG